MDSPAEYVSRLEDDLRGCKAALKNAEARVLELEARVTELEIELHDADELRGAVVGQATVACRTTVEALKRLEAYQPLVDAAVEWLELSDARSSPTGGRGSRELIRLVELEVTRRGAAS